jgi:hypothetical protein
VGIGNQYRHICQQVDIIVDGDKLTIKDGIGHIISVLLTTSTGRRDLESQKSGSKKSNEQTL